MARRDAMVASSISMSFDKAEAIKILKENRAEHEKIYNEAVEGYRQALNDALWDMEIAIKAKLAELDTKRLPEPHLKKYPLSGLNIPGNSLNEYDTVLEMLALTTDEIIVLNQDQYSCYMKDNWYWMKEFLINNSAYSTMAAMKLNSM